MAFDPVAFRRDFPYFHQAGARFISTVRQPA